jgi:magnesium-dependent phosphatase-1
LSPIKLVVFDLDRTIWNHPNVSSLVLPLKLVALDSVKDACGSEVTLIKGILETLETMTERGLAISVASWNDPPIVLELLRLLKLQRFFRFPQIEWDVPKIQMIRAIVSAIQRTEGMQIEYDEILFVDDKDEQLRAVREANRQIRLAKAWAKPKSPQQLLERKWLR